MPTTTQPGPRYPSSTSRRYDEAGTTRNRQDERNNEPELQRPPEHPKANTMIGWKVWCRVWVTAAMAGYIVIAAQHAMATEPGTATPITETPASTPLSTVTPGALPICAPDVREGGHTENDVDSLRMPEGLWNIMKSSVGQRLPEARRTGVWDVPYADAPFTARDRSSPKATPDLPADYSATPPLLPGEFRALSQNSRNRSTGVSQREMARTLPTIELFINAADAENHATGSIHRRHATPQESCVILERPTSMIDPGIRDSNKATPVQHTSQTT